MLKSLRNIFNQARDGAISLGRATREAAIDVGVGCTRLSKAHFTGVAGIVGLSLSLAYANPVATANSAGAVAGSGYQIMVAGREMREERLSQAKDSSAISNPEKNHVHLQLVLIT